MFKIKGYHSWDNEEYLWLGCNRKSEIVSAEGAKSFTQKEAALSSETMVHLHLTAQCHSPTDSIPLYIILLLTNNKWHGTGLSGSH
jgi:hypothetical protein